MPSFLPYMTCIQENLCNTANKCVQLVALHSNLANYGDIKFLKAGDSEHFYPIWFAFKRGYVIRLTNVSNR